MLVKKAPQVCSQRITEIRVALKNKVKPYKIFHDVSIWLDHD